MREFSEWRTPFYKVLEGFHKLYPLDVFLCLLQTIHGFIQAVMQFRHEARHDMDMMGMEYNKDNLRVSFFKSVDGKLSVI